MSRLTLDFGWIDPEGAQGLELRATWAQLQISVDGTAITRLIDGVSRSERSHPFLPLYPLAEWLATHWWFLFNEVETTGRIASEQYEKRHNIRYGAEGFALPSLIIQPLGEQIRLEWRPVRLQAQNLAFTASGVEHVPAAELQQTLSDFIRAVLRRLQEQGIEGTLLEREWDSIQAADQEELEFCATAASLGVDPYTLDEEKQEEIIAVRDSLPESLWPDFFAAADFATLPEQAQRVCEALESSRRHSSDLEALKSLRSEMRERTIFQGYPWQQGYDFAHLLRDRLGLNGQVLGSHSSLGEALGLSNRELESAILEITSLPGTFSAVVASNKRQSPVFGIPRRREEGVRFAFCRALFEYLTTSDGQSLLVTTARSERQQRNRAFAAEFLVPADLLRKALPSPVVGDEEIDDLAERFGVSPSVVRHQIQNHELATTLPD